MKLGKQCYCNYLAVWSIACEGHVLEFCSSYEYKSSPLDYLNGSSNAVFCLWQDEVTEMFQIFSDCVSGLWKFAENFFPYSQVASQ